MDEMQEASSIMHNGKKQYVMFDLFEQNQDIWYLENVLSSPEKLVEFIEDSDKDELILDIIPKWELWTASDDNTVVYGATKTIFKDNKNKKTNSEKTNRRALYIINSLLMSIEMSWDKYADGHGLNKDNYILDHSILPVKKWNAGMNMGPHFDGQDGHTELAFSMVTYLNDEYEGGEINFPNHNVIIKPKPGSCIIFPSQNPYVHEVKTIHSGTRYMVTTSILTKK
jgi:hypothetical protein